MSWINIGELRTSFSRGVARILFVRISNFHQNCEDCTLTLRLKIVDLDTIDHECSSIRHRKHCTSVHTAVLPYKKRSLYRAR